MPWGSGPGRQEHWEKLESQQEPAIYRIPGLGPGVEDEPRSSFLPQQRAQLAGLARLQLDPIVACPQSSSSFC